MRCYINREEAHSLPEISRILDRNEPVRPQAVVKRHIEGVINQPAPDPEALASGRNRQIVNEKDFGESDFLERLAQRRRSIALPAMR